jgi:hypothetical protein
MTSCLQIGPERVDVSVFSPVRFSCAEMERTWLTAGMTQAAQVRRLRIRQAGRHRASG